jgi:aconitate hydratase
VLLTGRVRPFVCARDVALELMRRGLADVVRRVEAAHRAPVVLEFAGPSARLLSVGERSVLAALAPQLGAAAALFTSDERTEVFLRDQRRSKAHRALTPDAGAPCDEVVNLDLGAVDPLLIDETGRVRAVRDLAGTAVSQVVLGGDSGVTLRDLFAAATLLKSKRVPAGVDFLLAVPSRQMLETLSGAGALTDLLATGARLIEPDARIMEGLLYPPRASQALSARTCDPEPLVAGATAPSFVVASAETLSYAVATGEIGDPRSFKRPVRVTVPRALPTDDVLVVRERRSGDTPRKAAGDKSGAAPVTLPAPTPWKGPQTLEVVDATTLLAKATNGKTARVAVLCGTLDEVRKVASRAATDPHVGAVLSSFIPSGVVALLSGIGVAALEIEPLAAKSLGESGSARSIALPAPAQWQERAQTPIAMGAGAKLTLTWLALGVERTWATLGTAAPARDTSKAPRTSR